MKEATTKSPAKFALQFGLLFGVIMVLEFVLLYVADVDPLEMPLVGTIMNVFNYLVFPVAFIAIACVNYRKQNAGYISLGESLKIGVVICLIASLISSVFSVIWNMIFPEYMQSVLRKTRDVIVDQNPNMPADQIETAVSMTEKFMSPSILIPVSLLMFCLIGLVYSLIIGAIVKKDQPVSF